MIPETATVIKGQTGGFALVQKYGREHMRDIGRLGGRPHSLTINGTNRNIASVAQVKERSHGKGLKELLRLWRQRQACSTIITQGQACLQSGACRRETRTGGGRASELLPVACGPGCNRGSGGPSPNKGVD